MENVAVIIVIHHVGRLCVDLACLVYKAMLLEVHCYGQK